MSRVKVVLVVTLVSVTTGASAIVFCEGLGSVTLSCPSTATLQFSNAFYTRASAQPCAVCCDYGVPTHLDRAYSSEEFPNNFNNAYAGRGVYAGCAKTVDLTDILTNYCADLKKKGQPFCSIDISLARFQAIDPSIKDPCVGIYKYFEFDYACVYTGQTATSP